MLEKKPILGHPVLVKALFLIANTVKHLVKSAVCVYVCTYVYYSNFFNKILIITLIGKIDRSTLIICKGALWYQGWSRDQLSIPDLDLDWSLTKSLNACVYFMTSEARGAARSRSRGWLSRLRKQSVAVSRPGWLACAAGQEEQSDSLQCYITSCSTSERIQEENQMYS